MTTSDKLLLAGVGQALEAFAADAPEEQRTVEAIRKEADQLFQDLEAFDSSISEIKSDKRLSDLGKEERLAPLRDQLRQSLEARAAAVERRVAEVEARALITPPALDPDPAVSEARLANARSDARMLLDSAGDRVADVMRQMVESNTDPAVTHLLMFTNWPKLYLQSRGGNAGTGMLWDQYRTELLERVLPPDQAAKARTVKALKHLKQAAQIAGHARHFALADRGL